jgi:hypothetical protein
MELNSLDTQKILRVTPNASKDFTGVLLTILVGLIAWIGTSLINRVDQLSENFNAYALKMESRITAVEQKLQTIAIKKDP